MDLGQNDRELPPDSLRRRGIFISLLVAGTFFMENLDGTVIVTAMPDMARSFGVAAVDLNIGISAYLIALGVFIPISGWIADRYGARRVFAMAVVVFTLASLLCGLASGLTEFVVMRVMQGVGGAMMVPVGRLVVLRNTPKEKLIGAIAILTWPALVAPVLGPPVGGFITTYADWRWIFYLNLPLGVIALAATLFLIPNGRPERMPPFDWLGFFLVGPALLCLMSAIEIAGHAPEWTYVGALFAAGGVLMLLGLRHMRRAAHPMLDMSVLRFPTFAIAVRGGSLFRMSITAVPFLTPLMLQIGFHLNAFQSGMLLMAVFAGNLAMKLGTTRILRTFGFRKVIIGNGILNCAVLAGLALLTAETPIALMAALLFVSGLTRSMQFTALNTIAFVDIPQQQMSYANTLFSTTFQLATGLGVALGAVAIRCIQWLTETGTIGTFPAAEFRLSFVVIALVSLIAVWESMYLQREAGDHVARPKKN